MAGREVYKTAQVISSAAGPTGDTTLYGVAIYVGGPASGTGSVGVQTVDGQDVQFTNVPAGTILPIHHAKVYGATAAATLKTTAQNIISLF
tara:strand:+ start:747 stop:1019 length:273 start_codon:yes stop_codon:yes gene_type:complete